MKILDRLPYSKKHSTLSVREEIVPVKPYQIIIWVSVAPVSPSEWNSATPAFPAILDIGTNHNFVISRSHLIRWAGIQPEYLRALGATRLDDKRLVTREADIWLYLRALTDNKLVTTINGARLEVTIRTARKMWWSW